MSNTLPSVPRSAVDHGRALFDSKVKEALEIVRGARGGLIAELPVTASLTDVISKVNEILRRLQ